MTKIKKTYLIYTYGCTMNYADTERICALLDSYGLQEVKDQNQADIIIFNTCSIKKKAEDKVFWTFKQLKKLRRSWAQKKFWITGCMVKKTWVRDVKSIFYSNDDLFKRSEFIDFVFRILDAPVLLDLLELNNLHNNDPDDLQDAPRRDAINRVSTGVNHIPTEKTHSFTENKDEFFKLNQKFSSPFQAIIPIQTWCDNFCSYCVVPFTRWREYSRPMKDILKEIKIWVKKWKKEIMLVGQNVNSYWKWLAITKRKWDEENFTWHQGKEKTPFTILLEEISKTTWVERIRFQSSNPHDMTDDIIDIITKEKKIMPNLHLALQSWNNEILKKMKRMHSLEDYEVIVKKIRSKDTNFYISTDIIVWFPWETDKQFQDTLKAIKQIKFDMIYVSKYSPRKWTYAWDKLKDDIPEEIKNQRWHIVNNLLIENLEKRLTKLIWKNMKILVEKQKDGFCYWKDEYNFLCKFKNEDFKMWDIVDVKVIGKSKWAVSGEA